MRSPKIKLLLLIAACSVSFLANAQFLIGYSYGYMPAYELNRDIYVYNAVNRAGLKKEMNPIKFVPGPVVGYRLGDEKAYFEMMWSRKVATTTSEFDSASVPFQRQMKFSNTTFNWGGGIGEGKFHAGLSFDFGFTKAKGKRGATDGFKDLPWVKLGTPTHFLKIFNRILPDANTVWLEYDVTSFLSMRVYGQLFWFKTPFSSEDSGWTVESWLFGEDLNWAEGSSDRLNSYGIALYFRIGK